MKKKKQAVPRFSIAAGLTWRMGIVVGLLWLTVMSLVTVIGARQLQDQWMEHANQMTALYIPDRDDLLPGEIEQQRIWSMQHFDRLGRAYITLPLYKDPTLLSESARKGDTSYETAAVFFEDGEPVLTTGDYVTFEYVNADNWLEGKETGDGYAYIDLSRTHSDYAQQYRSGFYIAADIFRLTGYFEGNQFVLQELAGFSVDFPTLYEGKSLAQWEQEKGLNWKIYYEHPQQLDKDLICVYTTMLNNHRYMETRPVARLLMTQPEELERILLDPLPHRSENRSLVETVIIRERSAMTPDGTYHKVLSAIRCYPLQTAMRRLCPVYIVTELLCVLAVVLYYFLLKRRVRDPLQQIIRCGQQDTLPLKIRYCSKWKEPYLLEDIYVTAQQELQTLRQENTQLKTALDYAQNAEISRRQLVSDITHELKTPLAVIRSYCEGLLTGIAPEKQGRYLDIIMEEADRMDAMVLEMLDLSRLEAGKVRLSQDQVELLGLTKGILDKLQPLMEAKKLSVFFAVAEDSRLTADEGRLGQVVTNLISNAIKYSPEGGQVALRIFQRKGLTYFSIENESASLSEEALEKVWESFYRTEQSRTTKGTGLGLSICKAIIELHRGTCQAKNTAIGVEFSFSLPS